MFQRMKIVTPKSSPAPTEVLITVPANITANTSRRVKLANLRVIVGTSNSRLRL
jgi:hypothetical protein